MRRNDKVKEAAGRAGALAAVAAEVDKRRQKIETLEVSCVVADVFVFFFFSLSLSLRFVFASKTWNSFAAAFTDLCSNLSLK